MAAIEVGSKVRRIGRSAKHKAVHALHGTVVEIDAAGRVRVLWERRTCRGLGEPAGSGRPSAHFKAKRTWNRPSVLEPDADAPEGGMTGRQRAELGRAMDQAEAIFRKSAVAEMADIGQLTFRRGKGGVAILAGRSLPGEPREDFHADI